MEIIGVGEMIINSVDRDGLMEGFDYDPYLEAQKIVTCPLVAVGGAGDPKHFSNLINKKIFRED